MKLKRKFPFDLSSVRGKLFAVFCVGFLASALFSLGAETETEQLICKCCIGVFALLAIWFDISRKSIISGIVTTVSALFFMVPSGYTHHVIYITLFVFWIWAQIIGIIVYASVKGGLKNDSFSITTVFAAVCLFARSFAIGRRYGFVSGEGAFYIAAAIGAALVTAVFGILIYKKRIVFQNDVKSKKASSLAIIFILLVIVTAGSLRAANHVFDTSEPVSVSTTVEDKYIKSRSKGGDDHYIIMQVEEGELKLDVERSTYDGYEKGDTINLKRHGGAFGIPFYLPDRYETK
ncbi:MAG: hypothetical protein J6V56_01570 [Clostridia bacterium]|nr:hypothetical protein [Clostridia bacterium]